MTSRYPKTNSMPCIFENQASSVCGLDPPLAGRRRTHGRCRNGFVGAISEEHDLVM